MKILLVEYDGKYSSNISDYTQQLSKCFEENSYEVSINKSMLESVNQLYKEKYNLVVLVIKDILRNKTDIINFLNIVNNDINLTTIIISNPENIDDLNAHFYFGYESDYSVILKNLEQLSLYMDKERQSEFITRDGLVINLNQHLVKTTNGNECTLSRTEGRILDVLLNNKNEVLSRTEILEKSGLDSEGRINQRVVDVHIKNIRDKLCSNNIATIRGIGYRWIDIDYRGI